MSTLAVIGTFYRRPWAVPRIADALADQSRRPDEVWLMWEDADDRDPLDDLADEVYGWASPHRAWSPPAIPFVEGIDPQGHNPLAVAINFALDGADTDYIAYLTDDSLPHPDKYRLMAQALDENPDWGAVYCGQDFGTVRDKHEWLTAGWGGASVRAADEPQSEPFARVDHTQVMHRRVNARWPLAYEERRLSDAHFFRDLVAEVGPLMPVPEILDWTRQLPDGLSSRG